MEEDLRHREIDIPGITLFLGNHQPSITSVLRAVKRAEHGILNCIASIVHDYEFVNEVATAFTPFPLLPNLRCGLWYSPVTTDSCYFKSTDGHSGEWSFSTARLNLHVAQLAALQGGVCIVDATRRGKTFPDALTKTIPIWATVINKALVKLKETTTSTITTAAVDYDYFSRKSLDLHLPHWISRNEKHQIEQRVDTWVDELLVLGVDLTQLQISLRKPLRCVWVSQEGHSEGNNDQDWLENEEIKSKYTLIVLISASIPNTRQRRRLVIDSSSSSLSCFSSLPEISRSSNSNTNTSTSSGSNSDEDVNEDDSSGENGTSSRATYETSHAHGLSNKIIFKEPLDMMYDYVPGAGDDEESWAKGLTPTLMWENIEELLRAGPEDIAGVVKRVVKSKSMSDRAQKRTGAGARAVGGSSLSSLLGGNNIGDGRSNDWSVEWIADCIGIGRSTDVSIEILKEGEEEGDEGLAILNVGSLSSSTDAAALELLENNNMKGKDDGSTRYLHLPVSGDKNLKRAVLHAVPAAVQFASKHLISSSSSSGHEKKIKNKLLVVAEPEATDIAASIVVAILIACFTVEDSCIKWSRPAQLFPKNTTGLIPACCAQ
ncbi:hypothetical protein KSW81_007392 [Nannochloris sp. 'desiccata']|nr:hypothetical protein KSW81_007392 [Chlorella desiccata (nom. nud.)]